jgi:hypothetical protein
MLSILAILALVIAVVALAQVRQQRRKLAELTEMYWQLRYDHGELKTTLMPPPAEPPAPSTAFVPLGSIKRSGKP